MNLLKSMMMLTLIVAACGGNKGNECAESINKGMDALAAKVKAAPNPQMQDRQTNLIAKLRGTLIQHCTDDKWASDTLPCFAAVRAPREIAACQEKLALEQQTKLRADVQQVLRGGRMPNFPGHPTSLTGQSPPPGAMGVTPPAAGSSAATGSSAAPAATGSTAAPAATGSAAGSAAPAGSSGW